MPAKVAPAAAVGVTPSINHSNAEKTARGHFVSTEQKVHLKQALFYFLYSNSFSSESKN